MAGSNQYRRRSLADEFRRARNSDGTTRNASSHFRMCTYANERKRRTKAQRSRLMLLFSQLEREDCDIYRAGPPTGFSRVVHVCICIHIYTEPLYGANDDETVHRRTYMARLISPDDVSLYFSFFPYIRVVQRRQLSLSVPLESFFEVLVRCGLGAKCTCWVDCLGVFKNNELHNGNLAGCFEFGVVLLLFDFLKRGFTWMRVTL